MKSLIIFVLICQICSASLAGPHRVGNGGNGVIDLQTGQVMLLDLVEAGLEKKPFFNQDLTNIYLDQVNKYLNATTFPSNLIALKLSEIARHDRITAMTVLTALKLLDWQFVDYELEKTNDIAPAIDIAPELIVQLANRRYAQVLINRNLWNKLNLENRAALVIHELIYSLSHKPTETDSATNIKTRGIMSYLFSEKIKDMTSDSFRLIIADNLPHADYISATYPEYKGQNLNLLIKSHESKASFAFLPSIKTSKGNSTTPIEADQHYYQENTEEINLEDHVFNFCKQYIKRNSIKNFYYHIDLNFSDSVIGYIEWQASYKISVTTPRKADICQDKMTASLFWKETASFLSPYWLIAKPVKTNSNF